MDIILCSPRGFCAGVRRAIDTVNLAIEKFGTPLYVKHEIVHNKNVVEDFEARGVIFTDDVLSIPQGANVVYSAHGVSDDIIDKCNKMNHFTIDATCPLVQKVHREIIKYDNAGYEIVMIGHENHPEVEGTMGKIKNKVHLVQNVEDAKNLKLEEGRDYGLISQTTLSVDDTKEIVQVLLERFPTMQNNYKSDICYATQNRQDAVKGMIESGVDCLIVLGSKKSSNSNRLRDIGQRCGVPSFLIDSYKDLSSGEVNIAGFTLFKKVGISAGASAPEYLVKDLIDFLCSNFSVNSVKDFVTVNEDTEFYLPKEVR